MFGWIDGLDDAAHEDLDAEDASSSELRPAVELRRVRVDEREHDEPGARARAATGAPGTTKLTRYWSSFMHADAEEEPARRGTCVHVSSPPPCSAESRERQTRREDRDADQRSRTPASPSPPSSSAFESRRRAPRSGSRTSTGTAGSQASVLHPVGHERQRDEPPGQQQLEHDVQRSKIAPTRVVQNVIIPSADW